MSRILKVAGEDRDGFTAGEWRRVLSAAAVEVVHGDLEPAQLNALANAARASATLEEIGEIEEAIAELREVAGLPA